MSSTHLSLYYHIVFSTKNRLACIDESWQERLHFYLGGILRGLKGVSEGIGGTKDPLHVPRIQKSRADPEFHCSD